MKAVARAMNILEYLSERNEPCPLGEITQDLESNKTSVYRTLQSLMEAGYVHHQEPGMYQIGLKICELSSKILDRLDLKYVALPYLKELNEKTDETVHLTIRDWSHGVIIAKLDCNHGLRVGSAVGNRIYLHATAAGKMLLSGLTWEYVEQIIAGAGLVKFTPNTITAPEALKAELQRIKEQGWSVNYGENEEGINGVAAPLVNYRQNIVGAVSIEYPALPHYEDQLDELKEAVLNTGAKISKHLGYMPSSTTEAW
jgi:IclR family acetate operon transcriptional repressor